MHVHPSQQCGVYGLTKTKQRRRGEGGRRWATHQNDIGSRERAGGGELAAQERRCDITNGDRKCRQKGGYKGKIDREGENKKEEKKPQIRKPKGVSG
jgi:hypothetical protein